MMMGMPLPIRILGMTQRGVDVQVLPSTNALSDVFSGSSTTAGLWECVVEASDGTDTTATTADIEVESDWPGTLSFNNCGQVGATGPTQSACDSIYSGTNVDGLVTLSAGIQYYTIPSAGPIGYPLMVQKAESDGSAVRGAYMRGDFTLSAGTTLKILVGQMGLDSLSMVHLMMAEVEAAVTSSHYRMIRLCLSLAVVVVKLTSSVNSQGGGRTVTSGGCTYDNCANMGSNGDGGAGNGVTNGPIQSGGGGFYTNGQASNNGSGDFGGFAFVNGGFGGTSGSAGSQYGGDGGFGGGGSGWHNSLCRSGGGGGYSGGQGGTWSGEKSGGGGLI